MSRSIRVQKDKIVTIYSLKYYELLRVNDSDIFRLYVKYNEKNKGEQVKIIDMLNFHDFGYIYY